jgi:hypothetical protein
MRFLPMAWLCCCKYQCINNQRFQNYYNNNNFRYNTYGVDKSGWSIYYKAISPTDLNSLLIISLGHF